MKISKIFIFMAIFSTPQLYTNGAKPFLDMEIKANKPSEYYITPIKRKEIKHVENSYFHCSCQKEITPPVLTHKIDCPIINYKTYSK